ncbi:MAG: ATP-binding protein [Bdellovibrionales bacterium]|nr:ATP-binding protein [Bdellovibrionales bacterium]
MKSLRIRIVSATVVLLLCCAFILASLLQKAFIKSLEVSEKSRLQGAAYTVLSFLEFDENKDVILDQATLSESLGEVEVVITDAQGKSLWPKGKDQVIHVPTVGNWEYRHIQKDLMLLYGFSWSFENEVKTFGLVIYDSGKIFQKEAQSFQKRMNLWLMIGCGILILLQWLMLQILFVPLRKVSKEVLQIEEGRKQKFEESYPTELEQLTSNINSLLQHERGQKTRFQHALDNLAHALKTPLTALRNIHAGDAQPESKELLQRVQSIIDYQIQTAATVGKTVFTKPVPILEVVKSLKDALQKVYEQKNMQWEVRIEPNASIRMDQGDLYEVLGNLLDNACKYGNKKIRITIVSNDCREIWIEDDGRGMDQEDFVNLTARGTRLDQSVEGSGIGLSVAQEILAVYDAKMTVDRSSMGGARIILTFQ